MQLVNCTPHRVDIVGEDGYISRTIHPSGMVARLEVSYEHRDSVEFSGVVVPVVNRILGSVADLPEPAANVRFIVSQVVANELKDSRTDLLFPADLIRDETGQVIGCKAMARP